MNGEQLRLGEVLRDRGVDAVEAGSEGWVPRMRRRAIAHSQNHGSVTADRLRTLADQLRDQPHSPNAWGAIFRCRGWQLIGRKKSTYGSNHAREIKVWRWVGK